MVQGAKTVFYEGLWSAGELKLVLSIRCRARAVAEKFPAQPFTWSSRVAPESDAIDFSANRPQWPSTAVGTLFPCQ